MYFNLFPQDGRPTRNLYTRHPPLSSPAPQYQRHHSRVYANQQHDVRRYRRVRSTSLGQPTEIQTIQNTGPQLNTNNASAFLVWNVHRLFCLTKVYVVRVNFESRQKGLVPDCKRNTLVTEIRSV
jgi:hypothetical protein